MPQYFVVATEADKPPNPSPGDIVKVLATIKEYTCFVTNLWSLTNSPCKNTYANHIGSADAVATGYTVGTGVSASGSPHNRNLGAGDGVHNVGSWRFEINISPATEYFIFNAKVGPITNGSVAGNQETVIGLSDNYGWVTNGNRTGCYFYQSYDGTWAIQTYDGFSGAQGSVISNLVDGDDITIVGQKDRLLFFVNGVLIGNHTSYITASLLFPVALCQCEDATVTVSRGLRVDNMSIEVMK